MLCWKARLQGIAYETVQTEGGKLPLLTPMSEVCGRMAALIGATYLQKILWRPGCFDWAVFRVSRQPMSQSWAPVLSAPTPRGEMAVGCGAQVTVLDINHDRLEIP